MNFGSINTFKFSLIFINIFFIVSGTSASFREYHDLVFQYDLSNHICNATNILFNEEEKTMFRHSRGRVGKIR